MKYAITLLTFLQTILVPVFYYDTIAFAQGSQTADSNGPRHDTSVYMIIDRIEITGDVKISPVELAKNLEIPVGIPMSASESSDLLSEGERRLKASGKYKDDLALRLVRGDHYPHFILQISLNEIDEWYIGAEGHFLRGQEGLSTNSYSIKDTRDMFDAEFYFGTRDYQGTGVALDIDLLSSYSKGQFATDSTYYQYGSSASGLTVSAIGNQLLSGHIYAGALTRAFSVNSWFRSNSDFSFESNEMHYRYETADSILSNGVYATIEPIFGVRISKLQLGGKLLRSLSRTLKERINQDNKKYVDGVLQDSDTSFTITTSNEDGKYTFQTGAELSVAWSDKSRLTVIEPGLDLHLSWSRTYSSQYTDSPKVLAHGEYSYLFAKHCSLTLLSDGEWNFQNYNENVAKVRRTLDIGTRFDFVTEYKLILFGEFYRVGAKRNELGYDSSRENGLNMKNRFNAGLKYASPEMIYSLSAGYGVPIAGESYLGSSMDSVYKRLGVR